MRRIMAAGLALCVLVSACGSGSEESEGSMPTAPTETEPSTTEPSTTAPPATEPPATEPPTTEPPVTDPASESAEMPEWVPAGWSSDDLARFVDIVSSAFDEEGLAVAIDVVEGVAQADDGTSFGLVNLAQKLPDDVGGWPRTVAAHVNSVMASYNRDEESLTFEEAAPLLRVRVGESTIIGGDGNLAAAAHRQIADDLMAFVVLDFPESVSYVSMRQIENWEVTLDDVYERAVRQTLKLPPPTDVDRSTEVLLAVGSFYTSTLVLDPTRLVPDIDGNGVVIGVPNADSIAITPATGITMDTIAQLAVFVRRDFEQFPSPVSDDLYWWHDGIIEAIAVTDSTISLPPGLQALVG